MKEAMDRAKVTQAAVRDLCNTLRSTATALAAARRDAGSAGYLNQDTLKTHLTKGALTLIDLKRHNRDLHLAGDDHEKGLLPHKAAVDEAHTQLQNFIYEQQQYQASIQACTKFESRHKAITLLPLEQYLERHPTDRPFVRSDPHRLLLNRLNFELTERKRGEDALKELSDQKAAVRDGRRSSEAFLKGLRDSLRGVKDATKPLQEYLHVQPRERLHENRKAALLPAPLYVLYQKWAALSTSQTQDALVVRIVGETNSIDTFANSLQKRLDDAEASERNAKKRRLAGGPSAPSDGPDASWFEPHPLSVEVAFDLRDGGLEAGITLRFYFLPVMSHIAVELAIAKKAAPQFSWITDASVLRNLTPDDDGRMAPNPATAYYVSELPASDPIRLPFKWAQWLAGFDFMFPLPATASLQADALRPVGSLINFRHRQSAGRLFRSIKQRLLARLCLCRQVDALRKRQFGGVTLAVEPGRWQSLEPVKFAAFEEVPAAPLPDGSRPLKAFKAVFHGDQYTFHAIIAIPEDYPETQGLVTLTCTAQPPAAGTIPAFLSGKTDQRAVELLRQCADRDRPALGGLPHVEWEVNYNLQPHCTAPVVGDRYSLTRQVLLLMRCLDILLHVQAGKTDRVCLRAYRGRDRALPFQWSDAYKMFEH